MVEIAVGAKPVSGPASASPTSQIPKGKVPSESAAQFLALLAHANTTEPSAPPPPPQQTSEELPRLLQQLCSGLYADAEPSANNSRVVLNLDAALPGAAAELVRDGAFLRVRLRAGNDSALRLMSAQRESLAAALGDATPLNVEVEVLQNERHDDGTFR
jgi:hypothetical protein